MARPPPQSYLLRLWRERADLPLRATLVTITQPAEQRHFATLDALHTFLRAQSGENKEPTEQNTFNCTALEAC